MSSTKVFSNPIIGCLASACSAIATNNPSVNKNDLFRTIIANQQRRVIVPDLMLHEFVQQFNCCEDRLSRMENRPKKGREVGECMKNSYAEFKETGNEVRMGIVSSRFPGISQMAVIHFFNVDKDGKFYDTEDRGGEEPIVSPATLLKLTHQQVLVVLAGCKRDFLSEANDWMSVWDEMNKKTYILSRSFGKEGPFKFVKTIDTPIEV
jgi:hypothetical protein